MLDNVVVPTDGTDLSAKAAAFAVKLAKKMGAKVTAVSVTTPAESITVGEAQMVKNPPEYEKQAASQAANMLGVIAKLAKEEGVACETVHVRDALPWHGIIETAKSKGADIIVMASHGRRGLSAMLLGSETQKVVNHSHIPVLIYR
jgi:nucleotide-binding universal stress UspA family protein